ncbi:ammonium transporter [Isosphaeraceae bacterium EP7]
MNEDAMKNEVILPLAWGGGIVAVALVATFARKLGYLDGDTVTRLVMAMNGLMIASNGNRLPKVVVPSACAQRARRAAGWSMALSGLVFAGLFVFAPIQVAAMVGSGAVMAGVAVTLGYSLWLHTRAKAV